MSLLFEASIVLCVLMQSELVCTESQILDVEETAPFCNSSTAQLQDSYTSKNKSLSSWSDKSYNNRRYRLSITSQSDDPYIIDKAKPSPRFVDSYNTNRSGSSSPLSMIGIPYDPYNHVKPKPLPFGYDNPYNPDKHRTLPPPLPNDLYNPDRLRPPFFRFEDPYNPDTPPLPPNDPYNPDRYKPPPPRFIDPYNFDRHRPPHPPLLSNNPYNPERPKPPSSVYGDFYNPDRYRPPVSPLPNNPYNPDRYRTPPSSQPNNFYNPKTFRSSSFRPKNPYLTTEDEISTYQPNDPNYNITYIPELTNLNPTTQKPLQPNQPSIQSLIPSSKKYCNVPIQPQNGEWRLEKSQCSTDNNCYINETIQALDPGSQLVYNCKSDYKLNGVPNVYCGIQGKWSRIPKCLEIRCPPLSSASRNAKCSYEDNWVSCENSVRPTTTATLSCRSSYNQDMTDLIRRDKIRCNAKGVWEPQPIKCISVCGVASTSSGIPLIVNGTRANISDFPWHATLYKLNGNEKKFICGATIIKDNLVVTAAHCVYDEFNKKVDSPSKFYIAVGNIFRDYDYEGHDLRTVKKATVKNIFIVCNYLGLEGNYASDIAILEIDKPFIFSSIVMPICLDISGDNDQTVLDIGNYGKVPGFGVTAKGASSFILQSLTVPYVALNTCKSSSIDSDSERYITIDKFCAGYTNGSSVCNGDSGGGLIFKTDNHWYLRGIVSVGIGLTKSGAVRTCDSYAYSLYTRVSNHINWIQDIIHHLDMNKNIPNCS